MDRVAKAEQIFGKIGAVLPSNAGEERNAPFRILDRHVYSNAAPGLPDANPRTVDRNYARDAP
jgi:hypothetical protein